MPTFEIQHPDGRSFEVEAPDMNAATNAFGAYNAVGGMFAPAQQAPQPAQPYSLGPVSDLTELGARGINAGVQSVGRMTGIDVGPPREPKPLGAPINLPGIGQPSAIGTGRALLESAKSGAALPGDVYAGRVDPLSDQGIGRAAELASLTPLSAMPSVVSRAPGTALAAPEIKKAATTAMDVIRDESRAVPIQGSALERFAKDISEHVNKNGPSAKNAPAAHAAIDDIATLSRPVQKELAPKPEGMSAADYRDYVKNNPKTGDLGDLIDSRQALMDIVRTGKGQDIRAAKMAVDKIDSTLEPVNPGLVARIKEADKNYAIALAASKQEGKVATAIREAENAGTGGNVGNKIRQAVEKDLKKGLEKDRLSPEVQGAMENVTQPGRAVNALRPLAAFDPTHSKLGAMFSLPGALVSAPATGGWSLGAPAVGFGARAMYDRIMRERAAKIAEVMRAQAPAAMAAPRAPGGILAGRQAPALAQPGILNLGVLPRNQY